MTYFQGMRQMRNHLLASQGYVVVSVDSRGSQNRGLQFEAHLRNRMGQVELYDQVIRVSQVLIRFVFSDSLPDFEMVKSPDFENFGVRRGQIVS